MPSDETLYYNTYDALSHCTAHYDACVEILMDEYQEGIFSIEQVSELEVRHVGGPPHYPDRLDIRPILPLGK